MYLLGRIAKTHGYNGTVVLVSEQTLDDELEHLHEIFVVTDGLPVPFPVEELTLRTDTSAHVKLGFVDSQNEAVELTGCEVYANVVPQEKDTEAGLEQWIGFTVNDAVHGNVGVIQQIEDYNGNIVLQTVADNKETLISLYPELVTQIDHAAKILHIHAPDGYF